MHVAWRLTRVLTHSHSEVAQPTSINTIYMYSPAPDLNPLTLHPTN